MANKTEPVRVGKIYYWNGNNGGYIMQIVHTNKYAVIDSAENLAEVYDVAKELGYEAVRG